MAEELIKEFSVSWSGLRYWQECKQVWSEDTADIVGMTTYSDTRRCTGCGSNGPFYKNKLAPDGLTSKCSACKYAQYVEKVGSKPKVIGFKDGVRVCVTCNRSDVEFSTAGTARTPDGLMARCKGCRAADTRKQQGSELQRRRYLRNKYGLTLERYIELLEEQDGKCKLCGSESPGAQWKFFAVDHDHACCPGEKTCGQCTRGLLCCTCNLALSFVEKVSLLKVANYLER